MFASNMSSVDDSPRKIEMIFGNDSLEKRNTKLDT